MPKAIFSGLFVLFLFSTSWVNAQSLQPLWSSDTALKVPESVLVDAQRNLLYVSNIDGRPDGVDGKGSIGKMAPDGSIIQVNWVTGLNAPKGMALLGNTLYVSDITELVLIDVVSGKIKQRIAVKGASFLNDVTVDPGGLVYVSDSREKKVHAISGTEVKLLMDKLEGPNGLLWQPEGLYVLDKGRLLFRNNAGAVKVLAEGMQSDTDGIERVGGKDFVVSCWSGLVYYVTAEGKYQVMLDTRAEKVNTADLGYNDATRTIFLPTFFKNGVLAFKLVP